MPATVQLNTRIDPEIKRRGDAAFARAGLSSSEVVRAVWSYVAREQRVPQFLTQQASCATEDLVQKICSGAGMVQREATAMGLSCDLSNADLESMQKNMYDQMADEIHGQLASS